MLYYSFIEPDMCMVKNHKAFKRFFSALTVMDKVVNIKTKPVLSGFDVNKFINAVGKLVMINGG